MLARLESPLVWLPTHLPLLHCPPFPCRTRRRGTPGPRPTIITPHGGPHTAYLAQYFMPLSFMVALGFNVSAAPYCTPTGGGSFELERRMRCMPCLVQHSVSAGVARLSRAVWCHAGAIVAQGDPPPPSRQFSEAGGRAAAVAQVVLLNYRGSTGYGEAALQSLPGAIGKNDVADCLASLQAAVDAGGWVCGDGVAALGAVCGVCGRLLHPCAVL